MGGFMLFEPRRKSTLILCSLLMGLAVSACSPKEARVVENLPSQGAVENDPAGPPQDTDPIGEEPEITPPVETPPVVINPGTPPPPPSSGPEKVVNLSESYNLRTMKSGVLEWAATLPSGTRISLPHDASPMNPPYRGSNGGTSFSSTGFYHGVKILAVPAGAAADLSQDVIDRLNKLSTGLYISAIVAIDDNPGAGAQFAALTAKAEGTGYKRFFNSDGKPKFRYTSSITNRFGVRLNAGKKMIELPGAEQNKWAAIMRELRAVADRTKAVPRSSLIIDVTEGRKRSLEFEKNGTVFTSGAWTIAVEGTAVRNGFANVPCAEFMSEILRQAYKRAGFSHFEDFNDRKGNRLDYFNGAAAVVNFSKYLDMAGWTPWDASVYIPPVGAFMMHMSGKTPGHTYIAAGDRGRFIVDNGTPQGRDLRGSSEQTLEIMFQHGVFFLPPGFIPEKWTP